MHSGREDITNERSQQVLEAFCFVVPPEGSTVHCNQTNKSLMLQIDIFCLDIVNGVKKLLSDLSNDRQAALRLGQMIKIHELTEIRL